MTKRTIHSYNNLTLQMTNTMFDAACTWYTETGNVGQRTSPEFGDVWYVRVTMIINDIPMSKSFRCAPVLETSWNEVIDIARHAIAEWVVDIAMPIGTTRWSQIK